MHKFYQLIKEKFKSKMVTHKFLNKNNEKTLVDLKLRHFYLEIKFTILQVCICSNFSINKNF